MLQLVHLIVRAEENSILQNIDIPMSQQDWSGTAENAIDGTYGDPTADFAFVDESKDQTLELKF